MVDEIICKKFTNYGGKEAAQNDNAFLLNASKIGIFTEWDLEKSALVFSINQNLPKIGGFLNEQIQKPNAKMYKFGKNLVLRYETHSKYFV